jgi:hypothetical protein
MSLLIGVHTVRQPTATQLERVKALLQNKQDPELSLQNSRSKTNAAIAKYVQAKSADEKAAAAAQLLGSEKGQALKAALKGVNDAAQKEQIVKQHLRWDEATQAAAALTQKHPEFTELKEVLAHFPPLVHHIGEPSSVQYKLKVCLPPPRSIIWHLCLAIPICDRLRAGTG